MTIYWPPKAPAEVMTYGIDFTDRLPADDPIAATVWTFPDGLTKGSDETDDGVASVGVSGGDADEIYRVHCKVTTEAGQVFEDTARLLVRER